MFFDTHAHLDAEQFFGRQASIVEDAAHHQVNRILTVATDLASSHRSIQLAEEFDSVYASVGIHPNYCHEAHASHWQEITGLVDHPKVVALGETGLDDHWDFCPMELQREFFVQHIQFSHASGLPFIVHMRDCEPQMMRVLADNLNSDGKLNGVMHSFCGTADAARQCLDWGMYISFAGMVTYKKNDHLRAIAATIPDDRLLIETDSPYLAPHPCRGQRPNTPSLVRHTLRCLATTRSTDEEVLGEITSENAFRFFGIQRPG